jgi:hypothetical protein
MEVDDTPTCEFPAGVWRQDSHVSGQDHVIGSIAIDQFDHLGIVGRTVLVADELERDVVLLG